MFDLTMTSQVHKCPKGMTAFSKILIVCATSSYPTTSCSPHGSNEMLTGDELKRSAVMVYDVRFVDAVS